jgi:hypothetical protein
MEAETKTETEIETKGIRIDMPADLHKAMWLSMIEHSQTVPEWVIQSIRERLERETKGST